jgi:phosphoacetylglucosamine mutase
MSALVNRYRVGVLAALRSLATGKATGVCVTASHNQEVDNGSKVADPDGGMLAADWEGPATALANAQDEAEVQAVLAALFPSGAVPQGACTVLLGRDTRASSPALAANVARGVAAAGGRVEDLGLVTTPQLHWAVMRLNRGEDHSPAAYHAAHAAALRAFLGPGAPLVPAPPPPAPARAARRARSPARRARRSWAWCGWTARTASARAPSPPSPRWWQTCAPCPSAPRLPCRDAPPPRHARSLARLTHALRGDRQVVALEAFNTGGEGAQLNRGCGAEHVQKERALPRGVPAGSPPPGAPGGALYASFDGDADRVVLFFVRETGAMELLDGDKIAALLAAFIAGSLEDASLPLSLGVVQTAYANGAATRHLGAHVPRAELACVATGVKHLHHKALDYDIGVSAPPPAPPPRGAREARGLTGPLWTRRSTLRQMATALSSSPPPRVPPSAPRRRHRVRPRGPRGWRRWRGL